ncbi:MAG TPA: glycine cleavage system aminomethyltransferase GcvT [Hyphomicrobiaceae bacterium]|jgi:aminomethyltransferase|nr:glycine cleavage system aminomethyltransferase GcvT [Hyphomicrobiaceae bacterium]
MAAAAPPAVALQRTPLHELHVSLGARMVAFAGYEMPVQYPPGILKEHLHTRAHAGLFDVSHMGQAFLVGPDHAATAAALEALVPADILGLHPGQQRYTQLLNVDGGIIDDLMVTRSAAAEDDGSLMLVANAARKVVDFAHISEQLPDEVRLEPAPERALLALQGPRAAEVLAKVSDAATALRFMTAAPGTVGGIDCHVSRSGYTGENGFEISLAADQAERLARLLLAQEDVQPIGLGARDSLRLEAGLCLYGHDIDETTSPVEAALAWSIQKRRRAEGGFPGSDRILRELVDGPARRRVGLRPDGRAPAREGTEILAASGERIGTVTSGGFGPSVNAPVAMGYVAARYAEPGTQVSLMVRGKPLGASVVSLPFVPHRYAGVRPSGSDTIPRSTP